MLHRAVVGVAQHSSIRKFAMSTPVIRELGWHFFAGEDLTAGLATVRMLNSHGIKTSLTFFGVHVRDRAEAIAAADQAIESLRSIRDQGLESHVSIKLTQIGLDIDEAFCREQVTRILDCAKELGIFVRVDMEETEYVDRTIRLFEQMRDLYGADIVGIVIQSYLRDHADDLDRLIAAGSRVRLVKGGYRDSPSLTYRAKNEIDAAFDHDIERLLRAGTYPAIATHDLKAINLVRTLARQLELDPSRFEFQMLYGVRGDLQTALVADGYTVRAYVPYGADWWGWFLRCMRRVPSGAVHRLANRVRGNPGLA